MGKIYLTLDPEIEAGLPCFPVDGNEPTYRASSKTILAISLGALRKPNSASRGAASFMSRPFVAWMIGTK